MTEPIVGGIMEYNAGYNDGLRKVNERLFE
jgi:hypothetical protein